MTHSTTLPLFPLSMTVLPGEVAALHLFEPRYRQLLADCEQAPKTDGDFVVVWSDGEHIDPIACAVTITRILERNPDDTSDILIQGCRRVRILNRYQIHSYDSVRVEDDPDDTVDWDDELATRVYALHRQLLFACTGDEPSDRFYEQRRSLAFAIASCSGFSGQAKREFLVLRGENQRLMVLRRHLETLLPILRTVLPAWKDILASHALASLPMDV